MILKKAVAFLLTLAVCGLGVVAAAEETGSAVGGTGPVILDEEAVVDLPPDGQHFRTALERVKHPAPWVEIGGDLRLRQVFIENGIDLLNEMDDTLHFFRIRPRLWARFGPFGVDEALDKPNGFNVYVRITAEPRPFIEPEQSPTWDEVVLDNLYFDWNRVDGMPISLRVGRQDMVYGPPAHPGFVILDGTPLDGSRTIYSDAIRARLHMDECKSILDLFYINNKGRQSRVHPLNDSDSLVSEFDATVLGAYLVNKQVESHELHAYYLYKDEDWVDGGSARHVHTLGTAIEKAPNDGIDYYAEVAGQWGDYVGWGRPGSQTLKAIGFSSDLGYTFADAKWSPRIHAAYEFLSGDDPGSRRVEIWDPVLARWPHWSELYVYSWIMETGFPGWYSNLHRFTFGGSVHPNRDTCLDVDYSFLRANENVPLGGGPIFSNGLKRGHLLTAVLTHQFSKYLSGHLWAEYFHPEDFYIDDTDEAFFLRWQVTFKF